MGGAPPIRPGPSLTLGVTTRVCIPTGPRSLEESNIGVAKCLTSISPTKMAGTICVGKVKGTGLTILANLPGAKLPPAKLKAFFDAASKRLP